MQIKFILYICALLIIISCNSLSSNQQMAMILEEKKKMNYDKDNPFCPEAKLRSLDSSMAGIAVSDNMRLLRSQYLRTSLLLEAGDEKQAFFIAEQLLNYDSTNPVVYAQLLKAYGIAALRLGERQNCVMSHSTESCLMPVQGMGIHKNQFGSLKAIGAYEALLKLNPDDLESRWLLNIACMTLGDYPAGVPAAWLIPGLDKDPETSSVKAFTDVAPKLQLDIKNKAGGVIADDFNRDGFTDIITSDLGLDGVMHYFKNTGAGGFKDISVTSGLSSFTGGLNMIQADYNNDGFTDIFVLRGAWMPGKFGKQPNSLLRNNGDETFTDVTVESGLFSLHPTQAGVWRDFNNDGWLDLFIGNETTKFSDPQFSELFINDQHGGFKDVASKTGCNIEAFVKGVTAADYNNDGWQDIFVSTCDGRRMLLKNKGIKDGLPVFEDVTHAAGLDKENIKTFPTWFWDYDNDGWPDIFVSGYQPGRRSSMVAAVAADAVGHPDTTAGKMYLYHNNHDGTFTNVSKQAGLYSSVFTMGSNFGDMDNDGFLDMYLGIGNPEYTTLTPNKLFRNVDGKKFADVTVAARVGNLQKGHGVAFSDIDNDGDQDIFIEVGGAFPGDAYNNSLYLNPGQNTNRCIYLSLEGNKSNRSAIGSRIKISFKENGVQRYVYRDVNSGGSFGASPLRREIGIGQAAIVDEITITWAGSNKTQTIRNIKPYQCIKITEGNENYKTQNLTKLDFTIDPYNILPCAPGKSVK